MGNCAPARFLGNRSLAGTGMMTRQVTEHNLESRINNHSTGNLHQTQSIPFPTWPIFFIKSPR